LAASSTRKEEMVNRINDMLAMEHRLSVWQFLSIRKYELEEMALRIEALYQLAHGHPYDEQTARSARRSNRGRQRYFSYDRNPRD
jgi:hypothetical protein